MAADPRKKLKQRFSAFLSTSDDHAQVRAVRGTVAEVLGRITDRGWRAYVVGGTLRDVMLAPPSAFPRDIDVIVSGTSQKAMKDEFSDLIVRQTRFGGLHLVRRFEVGNLVKVRGEVLFDVWRLEDTWGLRDQALSPTIENFVKTPFLNIDSVAIDMLPVKGRRRVVECGFFESLATRTLDINNEPNPFPLVCIVRSLVMAAKLDFALSYKLASFISRYSRWGSMNDLINAQLSHYGRLRVTADEISGWIEQVDTKLTSGADRVTIRLDAKRQELLWDAWPPIYAESPHLSFRSEVDRIKGQPATQKMRKDALPTQYQLALGPAQSASK